jgi:hypothetical protein
MASGRTITRITQSGDTAMQTRPQIVIKTVLFWIWVAWQVAIPSAVGALAESADASRPALLQLQQAGLLQAIYGVEATKPVPGPARQSVYQARNPSQGLHLTFTENGLQVGLDGASGTQSWRWGVRLVEVGQAGDMRSVSRPTLVAKGRRVEYRRDTITEWYDNGAAGVEQGFTLSTRPASSHRSAPLQLELAVSGNLQPGVTEPGQAIVFRDPAGIARLHYAHLKAFDSDGDMLPVRMEVRAAENTTPAGIRLIIDDRAARYPVTIDPLIFTEETILTPSDSTSDDDFGGAVAVDGDTAVVGAPVQDVAGETNQGAAYVYVRNGTTWTEQAKLLGSDSDALDHFGASVAIAGDTIVVGGDIGNVAYVFVRNGTTWVEQTRLTAASIGSVDNFGGSVAISGETVIVGAEREAPGGGSNGPGAALVFVRDGTMWTLQDTLFSADGQDGDDFGAAVALDGDVALIGAPSHDPGGAQNAGAAYVFARSGSTWTEQAKLVPADITAFDAFGYSAALDGDTALLGARSGNGAIDQAGAAYVFVGSGANWVPQAKLFPQNEDPLRIGGSRFGNTAALLGDIALVGAPRTDLDGLPDAGAAYLFERVGTSWSQAGKLTASDAQDTGEFGGGVALTQNLALVGASEQFSTFFGANAAYPYALLTLTGPLASAVLPASRSVQVGSAATAFATIINAGGATATDCDIAAVTGVPAGFSYQTTDPATNALIGTPDTPIDISAGGAQTFLFAFTPSAPFNPTDVELSFDCTNSEPAPTTVGLNTLLLSASSTPVADIVALAATPTGDGIVDLPGSLGANAFAVATVNVGASAAITATADTGGATLPVSLFLCESNPATGECLSTPATSVTTTIDPGATPTFSVFVTGSGTVAFDPANNRIFVRFEDGSGVTRGSTSVAVRTR